MEGALLIDVLAIATSVPFSMIPVVLASFSNFSPFLTRSETSVRWCSRVSDSSFAADGGIMGRFRRKSSPIRVEDDERAGRTSGSA